MAVSMGVLCSQDPRKFNQIQDYFINNELITKFQHAYQVGHSTNSAIVHMTDEWFKEMYVLDFSAAFDITDHALLIAKLKCYGFTDAALSWMESYLSGRRQRVFFNGSLSVSNDVLCGVQMCMLMTQLCSVLR